MSKTHLDIKNKKFGKLLVLEKTDSRNSGGCVKWKCKCDCGKISYHAGTHLFNGYTTSCGCNRQVKDHQKSGIGVIFQDYKHSAKIRKLEFSITLSEFSEIIIKNCVYCGSAPSVRKRHFDCTVNGIDRMNNALGYTLINCLSACYMCNMSKSDLSEEEFKKWIQRLIKFNQENK